MIEILGFAVSMESLSLTDQFLAPNDAWNTFLTQIPTSGLGRHIATTPTNSITFLTLARPSRFWIRADGQGGL